MIFAFSRVFAIPFHRVNGHYINREITQKKQTYAKIASHRNHRNFITNTDFTDLTDSRYCVRNFLSVISVLSASYVFYKIYLVKKYVSE